MTSSFNGGMSWQQYNNNHHHQKFPQQSSMMGGEGDVQEMHLKMSKKIAQLTKVIYALNTKNDEHESVIAILKESHEEEIQKLLAISTSKLQQVKYQMNEESELKRKVEVLQQQVSSFEMEKRKAMDTIERLQQSNKQQQIQTGEEQMRTIEMCTRELREAKLAFESRIADLQRQLAHTEREKTKNEDSKNVEYQRQISDFKRKIDSQELTFAKRISEVEERRDRIRGELSDHIESSEREVEKLRGDCDEKLEKAKLFYEHELSVARESISDNEKMMETWKMKEHQMKVDSDKQESKYRKKIHQLGNELEIRQEEIDKLQKELDEVDNMDVSEQQLRADLKSTQQQYDDVTERVTFLSNELDAAKRKMKSQSNDITQKSSIIGTLEAIKLTQDESIVDLEDQLHEKKQQLMVVEDERNQLTNNSKESDHHQMQQMKALATKLDKMQKEKESAKRDHEKSISLMKEKYKEEIDVLKSAHHHEVENMEKNYQLSSEIVKKEAEHTLEEMRTKLDDDYLNEKSQLENIQAQQLAKMNNDKNEINLTLQHLQDEMRKMKDSLERMTRSERDKQEELDANQQMLQNITQNYKGSEAKYNQAQIMIQHLRSELDGWRNKEDESKTLNEHRHIESLEKLKRDKDDEWEKILRSKLSDMRSRLSLQLNSERQNALKELREEKEKELEAEKQGWKEQMKLLTTQISEMRGGHRSEKCDLEAKMAEIKSKFSLFEVQSRTKERELTNQFQQQMEELKCELRKEENRMREEQEQEMEKLTNEISNKHKEEVHAQLRTHQVTIATMKENMGAQHEMDVQRREEEFRFDLDEVKSELMERNNLQLDQVRLEFEDKIASMEEDMRDRRSKSERLADETKQQISEVECNLENITNELQASKAEKEKQQSEMMKLKKELETKVNDVLQARSDANLEIKRREEELKKRFQDEQDNIEASQLRHKQTMVNEFNRATGMLKEKLTDLKITIHDLEDRYEKRESREEDVELIARLQEIINERESQLQQLMDDKKYYEMELVNRETNFNKVFNSTPNVGVLNPTRNQNNKKKKSANSGGSKGGGGRHLEPLRHQSSPSPISNLQPTPPTLPKKSVRSSSVDRPCSKDFFSEEASSQLDSYDDVTGDGVTMDAVMRAEQQQQRRHQQLRHTSRLVTSSTAVWRSELNLYVREGEGKAPDVDEVRSSSPPKKRDRGGWFFSSLRKKK